MYHTKFSSPYTQIFIVVGRVFCFYLLGKVLPPRNIQESSSHILKMTVPVTASLTSKANCKYSSSTITVVPLDGNYYHFHI